MRRLNEIRVFAPDGWKPQLVVIGVPDSDFQARRRSGSYSVISKVVPR